MKQVQYRSSLIRRGFLCIPLGGSEIEEKSNEISAHLEHLEQNSGEPGGRKYLADD